MTGPPTLPAVTLYGRLSSCNVQKALWALMEAGVAVERVDVGGEFGGLDDPAYRALNPHGRVPTLQDGDIAVWESDAIVRYVCARYAPGRLWPEDPVARARLDQWMAWTAAHLYPDWIWLFWALVRTPPDRQDPDAVARLRDATAARFETLDRHLAGRPHIGGEAFTMADIPAGMTLYRWFEMPIDRPATPHVEAWYARLRDRPAYRAAICRPYDDLVGRLPE
jgi:glutathione S-transferase